MYEDLKREVIAAARKAEETGLCRPRSGNFSRIDDERKCIAITPSGLDRMTMTEDDIIIIDKELKILENKNDRNPSSESLMHVAAYEARPDINAVAHTHSPYALAFAIIEKPVPPVLAESGHLGCEKNMGYIPVAVYGRQGSQALADSVKLPLTKGDAMLLAHHGVMTVSGKGADDALVKAMYVEDICAAYYRAITVTGGMEPCIIPPADLQFKSPDFK